MGSTNLIKEEIGEEESMYDRMLLIGEKFLEQKLTPVYYMDSKSNTTFIVQFEKAEHGLH